MPERPGPAVLVTAVATGGRGWPAGREWARAKRWAGPGAEPMVACALALGLPVPPEPDPRRAVVVTRGFVADVLVEDALREVATTHRREHAVGLAGLLLDELSDFTYLRSLPSLNGQHVARAVGAGGSSVAVGAESAAGGLGSLVLAARMVRDGEADQVVVAGADAGQPGVALLVESGRSAGARGANPLAEVLGWSVRAVPGGDACGQAPGPNADNDCTPLPDADALLALARQLGAPLTEAREVVAPGPGVAVTLHLAPPTSPLPHTGRYAGMVPVLDPQPPVTLVSAGAVTPCGATFPATWEALVEGRSGIGPMPHPAFDGLDGASALGSIDPALREGLLARWSNRLGRPAGWTEALAHESAAEALAGAGASGPMGLVWSQLWPGPGGSDPEQWAAWFLATARGETRPSTPEELDRSSFAGDLARLTGRDVVPLRVEATCAGGLRAVAEAVRMVRLGEVDEALAVGVVARNNPYVVSQFAQLTALSRWPADPAQAERPFDGRRSGMVISEAAAAVLVRRADPAVPGDPVIVGCGLAVDPGHPTAPEVAPIMQAVQAALGGDGSSQVVTVNAHGTGTRANDEVEARALDVLGLHVPLAAIKSMTGHASAASSVLELAVAAETLRTGIVPGVPNCTEPDAALVVDVSTGPRRLEVPDGARALTTSFGFGGQYAAVGLTRTAAGLHAGG